jgi:RNA polymerase sigma factor (sigma-70 family)
VNNDDSSEDDDGGDRAAALLRQLALAQQHDDGGLSADLIMAELLGRYSAYIRRIARFRLHRLRPSGHDLDDIESGVFERLVKTLARKTQFGKPFKYVVADNVDWECKDFARARRRRAPESTHAPEKLPPAASPLGRKRSATGTIRDTMHEADEDGPDSDGLAAQARAFGARIAGLPERDRSILTRRFLASMCPEDIADGLDVHRRVVDTATHRALKRLFDSDEFSSERQARDVRNARGGSEGEAA